MAEILIIGYGNTLRGDDGLGAFVVEQLQARRLPSVQTRAMFQLTPELAEEVSGVDLVIFVDASMPDSQAVTVQAIAPSAGGDNFTHFAGPGAILDLAKTLFDHAPKAWLVSAAGSDFGLREGVSPDALDNARLAVETILELVSKANIPCTNLA